MRRITVVAAALCIAGGEPLLADEDSQGFLRVVEGAATLIRVEDGQPEAARENTPALAGDRLSLAPGSRVEVILPDGHRLRLAESADLELVALARSLDENSAATALQLSRGALAIDVPREAFDRTRVDTAAAGVLLERGGIYLVEIDQRGATRVVVREGEAEVLTEYDTTPVRAGDEAVIDPDSRDRVALYQAPPLTNVEEWARQLEAEAARAEVEPVEPELRYAAQPLARYGSWVDGGAGYAWRPRVEAGWRPYWRGYWKYSPAGLVWCSYEPWGGCRTTTAAGIPSSTAGCGIRAPSTAQRTWSGTGGRPTPDGCRPATTRASTRGASGSTSPSAPASTGFRTRAGTPTAIGCSARRPRSATATSTATTATIAYSVIMVAGTAAIAPSSLPTLVASIAVDGVTRRGRRDVGAPCAPPYRRDQRSPRRERGGGTQPRGFGNDGARARSR